MTSSEESNAEPTGTSRDDRDVISTLYEVLAQHWAHAEQLRWTLLYNYSMASTILLLAWAAVFVSKACGGKRVILLAFSIAGLLVSVLWLVLQYRANGFVHMYEVAAMETERSLAPSRLGSFLHSARYREGFSWVWKHFGTRYVQPVVLCIFVALYAVLVCVSYAIR